MNPFISKAVLATLLGTLAAFASAADTVKFWDAPQYGANSFNKSLPDQHYFDALARTGATWVRLTFSKWDGAGEDFLLGDADDYTGIPQADLTTLRQVLDRAHRAGIAVVIVPLSLPGARWTQQNGGVFDDRLWSERRYWEQAAHFWHDLAEALRDHPAIAAYNILNEPAPERTQGLPENAPLELNRRFLAAQQGTARDLPGFYNHIIAAIREVDALTPIMVDGGYYANPRNLAAWPKRLDDNRILYAFHMYEPYIATSAPNREREVPLRYPGVETEYAGGTVAWDREAVQAHIGAAFDWADAQGLPATQIVAGEFGCIRTWEDCATYLADVTRTVNARGGHWAFYAFREDEWEGMDYEIPSSFPSGRFYWFMEEGREGEIPRYSPLMQVLKESMAH